MTNRRFHRLFGGPPRPPESPLEQRHMDLAASIQAVTEEVVLRIGRHVQRRTGMKHLVLAGGVALNCVANGRLLREGPLRRPLDPAGRRRCRRRAGRGAVRLAPAPGQAPPARGPRRPARAACSGPRFSTEQIERFLAGQGASGPAVRRRGRAARPRRRPARRRQGRRLVPGPDGVRPAGPGGAQHPGRSPLAGDAGDDEPQDQVPRELPAVRPGRAAASGPPSGSTCEPRQESPYMLLVAPVLEQRRVPVDAEAAADHGARPRPAPPGQRGPLRRSRR